MKLEGKVAIVTGGSRGIGAAIVRGVLDAGGRAIVHYCERGDLAAELVADALEDISPEFSWSGVDRGVKTVACALS